MSRASIVGARGGARGAFAWRYLPARHGRRREFSVTASTDDVLTPAVDDQPQAA